MECLRFDRESKSDQSYEAWIEKALSYYEVSRMLSRVGVNEALNLCRVISINRRHGDLEVLISRWSTESHISL